MTKMLEKRTDEVRRIVKTVLPSETTGFETSDKNFFYVQREISFPSVTLQLS